MTFRQIAKKVNIHPTAVIGERGFGLRRHPDGLGGFTKDYVYPLEILPHPKKVIIRTGVTIGSLCVVDRGSWRNTIIGKNTMIDSGCKIAHNVQIGQQCIIAPNVTILGSVTIGDLVFIGGGTVVKDHITIGDNAFIGCGANVTKDIPPNVIAYGNPAIVHKTKLM